MKFILFALFLTISGWFHAQLLSDSTLTRFCWNKVVLKESFSIDSVDNPGFEIEHQSYDKNKQQQVYRLKPSSSQNTVALILRSGKKNTRTSVRLTLDKQHLPEQRFISRNHAGRWLSSRNRIFTGKITAFHELKSGYRSFREYFTVDCILPNSWFEDDRTIRSLCAF